MALSILNVSDIKAAGVLFDVLEDTDSSNVVTTNSQNLGTVLILDEALDFSSLKIQL